MREKRGISALTRSAWGLVSPWGIGGSWASSSLNSSTLSPWQFYSVGTVFPSVQRNSYSIRCFTDFNLGWGFFGILRGELVDPTNVLLPLGGLSGSPSNFNQLQRTLSMSHLAL